MDYVHRVAAILNKPFPEDESRFGAPKTIAVVSLFVVFFLYVFEPFGISSIESHKFLICLGFGISTFLATMIYEFVVGQLLNLKGDRERWTFWKWIINNLGIMFSISLANFLFARLVLFGYIQWDLFPHMIYGTLMIGIIPVVVIGGWSLVRQEKKYQVIAEEINLLSSVNSHISHSFEDAIFDIPLGQVKFAEALQNYVKIGYVNTEGQFTTKTQRTTLKHILEKLKGSQIVKSHRSFLVNREAIISTEGNAQGLLLTLSDCDTLVPVSRSFVSAFRRN